MVTPNYNHAIDKLAPCGSNATTEYNSTDATTAKMPTYETKPLNAESALRDLHQWVRTVVDTDQQRPTSLFSVNRNVKIRAIYLPEETDVWIAVKHQSHRMSYRDRVDRTCNQIETLLDIDPSWSVSFFTQAKSTRISLRTLREYASA